MLKVKLLITPQAKSKLKTKKIFRIAGFILLIVSLYMWIYNSPGGNNYIDTDLVLPGFVLFLVSVIIIIYGFVGRKDKKIGRNNIISYLLTAQTKWFLC